MTTQPTTQPTTQSTTQSDKAAQFLALHTPGTPLLMPNAWDIGSAKLFAALDIAAIATTSGGFAATRGRLDGAMSKHEVL
ncbi:MAG TPA: isocitrate lyase/phosphoenolpyruvate mutase family protein, partial [Acidimicrobiales bacterium]